jgi:hypothetical protein
MKTENLSNKIIKMFIEENVPLSIQLEALRLAKLKIEFCKKSGASIYQKNIFTDD